MFPCNSDTPGQPTEGLHSLPDFTLSLGPADSFVHCGGWGTALCPRVSEERGKKRSWFHNAVAALHNAE